MSTTLPVTFKASPLPLGVNYTPQQFLDALVARLTIESEESFSLFTIGATPPTYNAGPWFSNGQNLYVWDPVSGSYIPMPTTPSFPFRGVLTADQDMVFAAAGSQGVDLVFTENFDPNSVFAGSTFTAPISGYYSINASARIGYPAGTPAPLTTLFLKENGILLLNDAALLVTPTEGMIQVNSIIQMTAGDNLTIRVESTAGAAGTVRVNAAGTYFCGHLVQKI